MPHFENIDKYEATNPKSGRKEIIPIAPHSLQAADYRPRKREGEPLQKKEKLAEFPEVHVEPISVAQMEKEFKMAARRQGVGRSRNGSAWSRFRKWLSGLFGSEKPRKAREGSRSTRRRGPRPERGKQGSPKQGQKPPQQGQSKDKTEAGSGGKRRRRRRSGNRGQGQGGQQGNRQGGQPGGRQGRQQGNRRPQGQQQQQQGQPGEGGKRNRNRRNRKRPSKGGNRNSSNNREE